MFKVFDKYIFKHLFLGTVFIAFVLTMIILLTQSLRFLELVIDSSASGAAFFTLSFLAVPRFLEIILPIAVLASVLFTYNKLTTESELSVAKAAGKSPWQLSKPALALAFLCALFMVWMTMWAAPKSLSNMQKMRQVIKAQYATAIFQEGVFNTLKNGLTVYIKDRSGPEMYGVFIHDARPVNKTPVLITAKKGIAQATPTGQRILISDGTRQSINLESGTLSKLEFKQYSLDIPDTSGDISKRWQEPDERTIFELLNLNYENSGDRRNLRELKIEIHRRIANPFLVFTYTLTGLCVLLLGGTNRRGQNKKIIIAIAVIIVLQGLFLASFNIAREKDIGLLIMYSIVLIPIFMGGFLLSAHSENLRKKFLYRQNNNQRRRV